MSNKPKKRVLVLKITVAHLEALISKGYTRTIVFGRRI